MVRSFLLALVLLAAARAMAQPQPTAAGRVVVLRGSAWLQHPSSGSNAETLVNRGDALYEGDVVRTGAGATLRVLMADKSLLDLGENSRVSLPSYKVATRERKATVKLWVGRLWARVASTLAGDRSFEVTTANAVAGVRGTSLGVDTDGEGRTTVTVESGSVELGNGQNSQLLGANDQGTSLGDGNIETSKLSEDDVEKERDSVAPDASLGDDSGAILEGTSDLAAGGEAASGAPAGNPLEGSAPPIDLDPGSSLATPHSTRIHGRVVLEGE